MISLIVAKDKNSCIGKKNSIPWRLKDDFKRFRELTSGKYLIMGQKTFESIAQTLKARGDNSGRLGDSRTSVVLTFVPNYKLPDNCILAHSQEEALKIVNDKDAFVVGGGMIYKLFLPYCDRLYVTEVKTEIEDGDTFFPEIDSEIWQETSREKHYKDEANEYDFDFVVYEKI